MVDVVLIGASGYLGAEVVRQLEGKVVVGTHHKVGPPNTVPFDVIGGSLANAIGETTQASSIIFCAHVESPDHGDLQAFERAVRGFLEQAARHSGRFVYVSSDAVFSGSKGGYVETDTLDAGSDYGLRLQCFERLIPEFFDDYSIIRTGYLYGDTASHRDSRVQALGDQLGAGGTVRRNSDMFKSPVHVSDAAEQIAGLAEGSPHKIIHLTGPRLSIHEFCRQRCEAHGINASGLEPVAETEPPAFRNDTSLRTLYPQTSAEP